MVDLTRRHDGADLSSKPLDHLRSTDGVVVSIERTRHGRGPTLLCAHATGFCGSVWNPMLDSDALAPLAAVSFDFRAHGRSTRPVDRDLSWDGMADDVLAVVEALGSSNGGGSGPLVGLGHSMGGAALLLAEQRRPGTFAGLWLYEPIVIPRDVEMAGGGNVLAAAARRRRRSFPSAEAAVANYAGKPPLDVLRHDALEEYVRGGFEEGTDRSMTLRCRPDDEAATFDMGPRHAAGDHLDLVHCPVVVVRGSTAGPGPATFAPGIAEGVANGVLEEAAPLGHFGPMEDPDAMAASVSGFIAQLAI